MNTGGITIIITLSYTPNTKTFKDFTKKGTYKGFQDAMNPVQNFP